MEPIISICVYNRTHENGGIIYKRLADIRDDEIIEPDIDYSMARKYENRTSLYYMDKVPVENELIVLEWYAETNTNDPEKDHICATEIKDIGFFQIVKLSNVHEAEKAIENLIDGVPVKLFPQNYLFQYDEDVDNIYVIRCPKEDLVFENSITKLSPRVYSVSIYKISKARIIETDNRKKELNTFRFYNSFEFPNPIDEIRTKGVFEVVKRCLIDRISWKTYRDVTNGTRKQFQQFKRLLEVVSNKSFIDEIVAETGLKEKEVKKAVKEFEASAEQVIDGTDLDDSLLQIVLLQNDNFKSQITAIAEETWKAENQQRIDLANKELKDILEKKAKSDKECADLESSIQSKKEEIKKLHDQIIVAETLSEQCNKEAEKRISEAKENIASFLGSYMVNSWFNQNNGTVEMEKETISFHSGKALAGNLEEYDDIEDFLDDLAENLKNAGVKKDFRAALSAYLYSSYYKKDNLLLVGPNGLAIADALSSLINGKRVSILSLNGNYSPDVIQQVKESDTDIIAVKEFFGSDHFSRAVEDLSQMNKMIIFLHPFAEDLMLEPNGLINYMTPLFTDQLIEDNPKEQYLRGSFSDDIKHVYENGRIRNPYNVFTDNLAVSPLVIKRLTRIIRNIHICVSQAEKDRIPDIDLPLILYPVAYMTDNLALLMEVLSEYEDKNQELDHGIRKYIVRKLERAGIETS